MVKIKISDGKITRTFYTRKDWKNGQKLYMYYPKCRKMTGNWYNDPGYDHLSWQDYEREYSNQCNGIKEPDSKEEIELKKLVSENNKKLINLANKGIKKVTLSENKIIY